VNPNSTEIPPSHGWVRKAEAAGGCPEHPPTPVHGRPSGHCRKSRKIAQTHLQPYVDPYREGYTSSQRRSARRESEAAGQRRAMFAFFINLLGSAAGKGLGLGFPHPRDCEFGKPSAANPLVPTLPSRNGHLPAFFATRRASSPTPPSKQWTMNK